VDPADLTVRARIRDAALRLYARHGTEATSVRMVADEAGVSPGAVTHHYKSKDRLADAVQQAVLERVREAVAGVGLESPPSAALERRRTFDAFLTANPEIEGYLRQVSLEGSAAGSALFADSMDHLREEMDAMVEAGIARPMPDPAIGLVLYRAVTMAHVFFRPLIEESLGLDLSDPQVRARFREAAVDLLSRPVLNR
jgi:AcrR family transcriptional regulator